MTHLLAVTTQQKIGLAIAIVAIGAWLVYIFSTTHRSAEPGSEIELAPNRRPYFQDDAMEGPRLDRALIVIGLELLAADHIQSGRLGRDLETLRGVATIYLPVVQDIGLRAPLLLLQRDLDGVEEGASRDRPLQKDDSPGGDSGKIQQAGQPRFATRR